MRWKGEVVTLPRSEDPLMLLAKIDADLKGVVTLPRSEDPLISAEYWRNDTLGRNSSKIGRPTHLQPGETKTVLIVVTLPRSEDPLIGFTSADAEKKLS